MPTWEIEVTDEFVAWWDELNVDQQESLTDRVDLLAERGPDLGRPVVDRIQGSRHHNMKELRASSDGEFQWSVHGEGSVEGGGALVVEAAAALVVDDVGGVLGLGGGDRGEVGAAGEPPAPLPVEVLDLAALPR